MPEPVLHQRSCTKLLLGATTQAVHELVPPDVLAPVLKQLADQFINDRTRPEVMVVGMRAVRELAQRAPLLMTPDLLQVRPAAGLRLVSLPTDTAWEHLTGAVPCLYLSVAHLSDHGCSRTWQSTASTSTRRCPPPPGRWFPSSARCIRSH